MALQEKHYTSDDLWELSQNPENEGKRVTLIDGRLYSMPPAGWIHGEIALTIGGSILAHIKRINLGIATAAETGYILDQDTVLAPDVGFIAKDKVPENRPAGFVPFAPDLAVEVVSPSNSPAEISSKIEKYILHGTRLVWIVYPEKKTVNVYRPSGDGNATVEFLDIDGTLEGGDVLPEFSLKLRDIFPNSQLNET